MGRLHTIGKVSIRVCANDHLPPHFHIVGADDEALIEIAPLEHDPKKWMPVFGKDHALAVLAGSVPDQAALNWTRENLDAVRAEWNRINPRFPIA